MTKYLILTHGSCMDGICAAMVAQRWCVAQELGRRKLHTKDEIKAVVEVRQCDYGMVFDPIDCRGKTVLITDYAFPFQQMLGIERQADRVIWLDHHKTNEPMKAQLTGMEIHFDLNRSGAGIAWDVLFQGEKRPWLVDYVEDRDLWRYKLPSSREVNYVVQATAKNHWAYEDLLAVYSLEDVMTEGRAMAKYVQGWVEAVADTARRITFCGLKDVPIVTCTYNGIADVLERMCVNSPSGVAIAWLQRKDGMFQYSLRSDGRLDVSDFAKRYGGGGHHNAAGFQLTKLLEE